MYLDRTAPTTNLSHHPIHSSMWHEHKIKTKSILSPTCSPVNAHKPCEWTAILYIGDTLAVGFGRLMVGGGGAIDEAPGFDGSWYELDEHSIWYPYLRLTILRCRGLTVSRQYWGRRKLGSSGRLWNWRNGSLTGCRHWRLLKQLTWVYGSVHLIGICSRGNMTINHHGNVFHFIIQLILLSRCHFLILPWTQDDSGLIIELISTYSDKNQNQNDTNIEELYLCKY